MNVRLEDGSAVRPEDVMEDIAHRHSDGKLTDAAAIELLKFNLPGIESDKERWQEIVATVIGE